MVIFGYLPASPEYVMCPVTLYLWTQYFLTHEIYTSKSDEDR